VLADYFNHIALASPAFYSCKVNAGTGGIATIVMSAAKINTAQTLSVTSVPSTGQYLVFTITCENGSDSATTKSIYLK